MGCLSMLEDKTDPVAFKNLVKALVRKCDDLALGKCFHSSYSEVDLRVMLYSESTIGTSG